MPDPSIRGACVCGAVTYEVQPPFLTMQYCHCSRCRASSGSAHAANLFVPAAQLSFTAGQEHVRRFELPTAKYWCNAFCDVCGSRLPWLSRTGRAWIVGAGGLEGPLGVQPERNIYFGSRASWYVHPSELETFDEASERRG